MTRPAIGHRPARLLVSSALLALVATAWSATAAPAQTEEAPPTTTIEVTERSAWVGDDTPVTIDVTVAGDTAGTTMRARIHPVLETADDLEASLTEDVGGITRSVDLGPTDEIAVAADGTRRITLTGDDIRDPGVHPVVIEVRSPAGELVDLVRTPVIRLGTDDDPLRAPQLSIVVDVVTEATVGPTGRRELTESELDRLERVAGFLDEVATLDDPPPVTVLAVPDTLDALAASSDARAAAVLATLESAVADRVVSLPYVPVSAGALAEADLDDVIEEAFAAGAAVLADRFGTDPTVSLWPDDDVTPEAARILAERGIDAVLTDETGDDESEVTPDERLLVPAGPRPVPALDQDGEGADLAAVVVDAETTSALTAELGERADAAPVALAELVLRDDGRDSSVVLRLDDVPDHAGLLRLLPLLTAPDAPVEIVAVPTAPAGRDPDDDEPDVPDPVTLPTGSGEDLTGIADRYRRVDDGLSTFAGFIAADSARASDLRIQQLTSVALGLAESERVALLDAVGAVVDDAFGGVTLTGQTDLNLTSRTGTLPIAITNTNDFPVRVMVRIRSDRLRFPDGGEFEVVAEPDITRLDVPVEALATGSVPTFVEIRTPDAALLIDDRQLNVRSTAFSGAGLALSLGALAVLAVWWIRTWRRGGNPDE